MYLKRGKKFNPRVREIMNIMNIPWSGGYSSNLWENPLSGNLHHNISPQPSGHSSAALLMFVNHLIVLTQPAKSASTIIFGVTIFYRQDKTRLGVNNWFLHWTSAINCLNANLCVRFLDSSWYLFQLESPGTNVELWETSNGFATLPDRVGRRVGTSW